MKTKMGQPELESKQQSEVESIKEWSRARVGIGKCPDRPESVDADRNQHGWISNGPQAVLGVAAGLAERADLSNRESEVVQGEGCLGHEMRGVDSGQQIGEMRNVTGKPAQESARNPVLESAVVKPGLERAASRGWAVAVVDRSNLRIYRVERAGRWPRLNLVAAQVFPDARMPDCAVYSGEPGAYAPAGPPGFHRRQGSMPERHLDLEAGRRVARALGRKLNEWMGELRPGRWCLALAGELEAGVLKELDPEVRNRLLEVVPRNLVPLRRQELLGHFPRLELWLAQKSGGV
jgi:hypothetical protein